ncbi:hypothetical protein L3Q82_010203 [Scortum barcoo]|uniref:Uncharacterized protein n=1 Tax=Scortum barcoo TaxID=214431 RepID=A0ACB8WB86_9TELE|nr:hypothetical protein L3Q82_010203 [Scortum barcoo]
MVRRATSLLSRQYAHYLNSYPGLPLYHGPLDLQHHSQASSGHPSPSPVCQLLACGGGRCGSQRALLYQDSVYGAYGVYQGSQTGSEALASQGAGGQPAGSPCVLRPWRRVSSLESERVESKTSSSVCGGRRRGFSGEPDKSPLSKKEEDGDENLG